jgi:hypothetical protein
MNRTTPFYTTRHTWEFRVADSGVSISVAIQQAWSEMWVASTLCGNSTSLKGDVNYLHSEQAGQLKFQPVVQIGAGCCTRIRLWPYRLQLSTVQCADTSMGSCHINTVHILYIHSITGILFSYYGNIHSSKLLQSIKLVSWCTMRPKEIKFVQNFTYLYTNCAKMAIQVAFPSDRWYGDGTIIWEAICTSHTGYSVQS